MRWLLFLSRLSLICGVLFIITLVIQAAQLPSVENLEVTLVFIWFFMLLLLNPAANLCCLLLYFTRRARLSIVPTWLRIANFILLLLLIFYIIYLNAE